MDGEGICDEEEGIYNPYIITNDHELQAVLEDLDGCYAIENNIDVSGTNNWYDGAGFDPVNNFDGELYGSNYDIRGLYVDRPEMDNVGLIGDSQGYIENIRLSEVDITGNENVGGFMGLNDNHAVIENAYASGTIEGETNVGGLIGRNNQHAEVTNSYSDGLVIGTENVGGLLGVNREQGNITQSYSSGTIFGDENVGGLLGENRNNADILDSYASGTISGDYNVGGLIGKNNNQGNVDTSYASSIISGEDNVGGLIGNENGVIEDSYWDVDTTGIEEEEETSGGPGGGPGGGDGGGEGLSNDEITGETAESNLDGFDFENVWMTTENGHPILIDNNELEE